MGEFVESDDAGTDDVGFETFEDDELVGGD